MFLRDIISILGGEAIGEVQQSLEGVGTIEGADHTRITFLANPKYRSALGLTQAGAVILGAKDRDSTSKPRIVADNPYAYFAQVAQLFSSTAPRPGGVHANAVIHPGAIIPASAYIAEFVSIGANANIGERVQIGAGSVIGDDVTLGADSVIAARVTVYPGCKIGQRAIIHSGVVIGADGFGFAPDFQADAGCWVKIPQTGRVLIGDDCEIGANTTIDRGAIEDTIIGNDVKLDNQIQVGHNCTIGDHTVIAGCVGIAGSTRIGKRVMIGGAAGFTGHLEVCDGAIVSAMTLVTKSITEPGMVTGVMPQMKHKDWLRNIAHLRQLDNLALEVKAIKKKGSAS
ncbi:MAG: UDP-3-O-(3-hydroxymyristoyl)glucosamine N-acyltransferase [Burkholderiales bacterium]|nr:UDP-3-O-(3-hydroxymyristoyl)glucosamine N-acyltransferase [Burkholderiales bacterium]